MLTKARKYISMKKLIFSLFLLINLSLIATDTPQALVVSFFERLSTQGIRARVLHLSTSNITTDYGTCIITDDEIIVTIDGQTVHWATPGGPWDIEYYSQTGELKLVPRKPIEIPSIVIPTFKPHSFEPVIKDFPQPDSYVQQKFSDMRSRPVETPIVQVPTIDTPAIERPLPERTLTQVPEKESQVIAPIDQEKAIATLLTESNKLIFEKIILQIRNSSEEQVHQIMASIKAQVQKQHLDEQLFFNQLKESVEKTMKWYAPPHRSSSFGLAVGTVAIGTISVGLLAFLYHLYQKNHKPLSDKLNHIDTEVKKLGTKIKKVYWANVCEVMPESLDKVPLDKHQYVNNLVREFARTSNQQQELRQDTLDEVLTVSGLSTGIMTTVLGIGSFTEWYYQWDKKRYQLLSLLNNEIEKCIEI